jgi:hypothetical protein
MPTMGLAGVVVSDPWATASPAAATPPVALATQYPRPSGVAAMATTGAAGRAAGVVDTAVPNASTPFEAGAGAAAAPLVPAHAAGDEVSPGTIPAAARAATAHLMPRTGRKQ